MVFKKFRKKLRVLIMICVKMFCIMMMLFVNKEIYFMFKEI